MTLTEAKKLARNKKCFIVTNPDGFLLYRENTPKNTLIGKRKTYEEFIKMLKKSLT